MSSNGRTPHELAEEALSKASASALDQELVNMAERQLPGQIRPMSCTDLGTRGVGRLKDYSMQLRMEADALETQVLLKRHEAELLDALCAGLPRELGHHADSAVVMLVDALAAREET